MKRRELLKSATAITAVVITPVALAQSDTPEVKGLEKRSIDIAHVFQYLDEDLKRNFEKLSPCLLKYSKDPEKRRIWQANFKYAA